MVYLHYNPNAPLISYVIESRQTVFDKASGDTAAVAGRIVYAEAQPDTALDKKKRKGKKAPPQEIIPTIGGGASLIVIEQEGWDPSEPELQHKGGMSW